MQQLQLPFIFILIFLKESCAIDLCLFIDCNNQNPNGSGRSDDGPAVIQIDQDWIQPENSQNDQLYHFGNNANSMNWYVFKRELKLLALLHLCILVVP